MRLSQAPPTLLSLLLTVLSCSESVKAIPFSFDFQEKRQQGNCGADLQFTCTAGEGCYTTSNVAFCSSTVDGGGGFAVYTTTYTETDLVLRTSTYTSSFGGVTLTPIPNTDVAICSAAPTEYSCGPICCASTQGCFSAGSCTEGAPSTLWSYASMPGSTVTNTIASASAPLRPTSGSLTATITSATTTTGFISPATASGSTFPITQAHHSSGLSGGAIAGIVIGVIALIIILLIICFCCLGIQIFEAVLRLFGLGKKKRTTERTEVVERYSRHGSGSGSRRETHSSWAGRPSRPAEREKKKSSGFGGLGAVGAALVGLAVVLGLKRRHDRKKVERVEVSSSYYTDSYTGTSESSASSRTRDSRRHHR